MRTCGRPTAVELAAMSLKLSRMRFSCAMPLSLCGLGTGCRASLSVWSSVLPCIGSGGEV